MSSFITLATEHQRDLPVSPYVVGISIFATLCLMMVGVLIFGKGRPHS